MGGGDLNLKKSWHPSTMKNMEKVWKAEQQNTQEKKRIAELQRDIERERDREDITKLGMQQGTLAPKDNEKINWMYTQPNSSINREDYLKGKTIDKTFEQIVKNERDLEKNKVLPSNHVEHECIPPSLRFFTGNEQVDLQRKIQEDPLFAIKKKEYESRAQILNNPVKLKQLKELASKRKETSPEKSSSSSSSSSRHKSKRHHKESSHRSSRHEEKSKEREKEKNKKDHHKKKPKLTDEERKRKLREMMANASWHDKERAMNVKKYREQEKKETTEKTYNKDFIRKQLMAAAEHGTVASRIKSNINNIQRSERAMDSNFARR